jgi:SAM-dependent methyltransferase
MKIDKTSFVYFDQKRNRFIINDKKIALGSELSSRLLLNTMQLTKRYCRGKLLDIGCGSKPYQSLFTVDEYIGVDSALSPNTSNIEAYADAQVLPFENQTFDTVICTEVIEHLPCPWEAIREMKRVLKPSGYLILTAPFIHWHHESPNDHFRFTYYGLLGLVSQVGFLPVAIWERGGTGSVLIDIFSRYIIGWLKSILRHLHFPQIFQMSFLRFLFHNPQRLIGSIIIKKQNKNGDENLISSIPSPYSLGYTLVAIRGTDKE